MGVLSLISEFFRRFAKAGLETLMKSRLQGAGVATH
jgi:hypothetical protein